MANIEIFLQGEGKGAQVVAVPEDGTVSDLLAAASAAGFQTKGNGGTDAVVLLEDADEELDLDAPLRTAGVGHYAHVHIHRSRRIDVTVTYNGMPKSHRFGPGVRVGRVHAWATDAFKLSDVDATEHALQICGTATRPDEDVHIGTLASYPAGTVCFDLVPKKRVEG